MWDKPKFQIDKDGKILVTTTEERNGKKITVTEDSTDWYKRTQVLRKMRRY